MFYHVQVKHLRFLSFWAVRQNNRNISKRLLYDKYMLYGPKYEATGTCVDSRASKKKKQTDIQINIVIDFPVDGFIE